MTTTQPSSIDQTPLDGPPPTSARDFQSPKLRRFSQPITLLRYLGHGHDGLVYEAVIPTTGLHVAVKMFWRTRQPARLRGGTRDIEWPFQHECAVAAILEKMKYAIRRTKEHPNETIRLIGDPQNRKHAIHNFMAFCDERRTAQSSDPTYVSAPDFPRVPTCYGWTKVTRRGMPIYQPVDDDTFFWALVYELVQDSQPVKDLTISQNVLDFFYQAGFTMATYKENNWCGATLLDMNDLCPPTFMYWHKSSWLRCDARVWFSPPRNYVDNGTLLADILSHGSK
ncbi:hypothetical protein F4861DRAFT_286109 [Xylaria intraflava]|nr:hypothetical protein F4861DRAFT_286109 [Xylaria intraflava]